MRLHESQNFHFHNVHNNAGRLAAGEIMREFTSFTASTRALGASIIRHFATEIHLQLIGNLMLSYS